MGGLVFLMMYPFPFIAKENQQLDALISQLPKGLRASVRYCYWGLRTYWLPSSLQHLASSYLSSL